MNQQSEYRLFNADKIDYRSLMERRIRRILLVCNSYDGYVLEEDGHLESRIIQEYGELNLSNPPTITRAKTTVEALALLEQQGEEPFDVILTMFNVGEMSVFEFACKVKQLNTAIPVILLNNYSNSKRITQQINERCSSAIDYVFFWHGSTDLIMTIVKLLEDSLNAEHDILEVGVQAILLVEDSVRFYSTYLPLMYRLILQQTSEAVEEALNESQQSLRKRARPKILLATNYQEAVALYRKYRENLMGVISDIGFAMDSDCMKEENPEAGIELCKLIKKDNPLIPFIMQSSQKSMRTVADSMDVGFIEKNSKTLLLQLSDYILNEFSFGRFVFVDPETNETVGTANNLRELEALVRDVPAEVLAYSASQNKLSKWLLSRGLFSLGMEFKLLKLSDFESVEELRIFVVQHIKDYRLMSAQGIIAKFDPETYSDAVWYARIGNGSLGGKARGLAFINRMLQKYNMYDKYDGVRVSIPRTVVITTDYFDQFIKENGLRYVINSDISDEDILSEFISSRLPQELLNNLKAYVRYAHRPIAVRSSSRLEDSYYQPFAGIYSTYMVPVSDNKDQFLRLIGKAIKSVYASVYFASSRAYVTATGNVISEEKMAVVLQEVCGTEEGGYYFPTLSGVARSENFYPLGDEKPEDGIAKICLGLGKAVVDGEQVLRFSPKYPKKILQLSTPELAMRDTQKVVFALSTLPEKFRMSLDDTVNLERLELPQLEGFRNMRYASSTWDAQNQRLSDSPDAVGPKVITFAPLLKYDTFPLAEILDDMLTIMRDEMNVNLEIEFAANLDVRKGGWKVFNMLQVRPITTEEVSETRIDWSEIDTERALLYSESALGVGHVRGISDVVYVKLSEFNAANTRDIAAEIGEINARMKTEGRNYVLIGPGRWGSSDPWLGIPVKWSDISEARVIVECGTENYRIEPSQGTHFFQNLTAFGVGYMTINPAIGDGGYDESRLNDLESLEETAYVRCVRFPKPLEIVVDGVNNRGVVKIIK